MRAAVGVMRRFRLVLSSLAVIALGSISPSEARADDGSGMRSPGTFGIGVVLSALGIGGLGAGGYFFGQGSGACDEIDRSIPPSDAQVDACTHGVIEQVGGVVGLVAGGAFAIAGVSLVIAGAVPAEPERPQARVSIGAQGATLSIAF